MVARTRIDQRARLKKPDAALELYDPKTLHCSWVVDFPMFAHDAETGGWAAMHHPFTAPRPQDIPLLQSDPAACRAVAYDLVINGSEAGGGTIRIHDSGVQQKVFELIGLSPEVARERFGFLLDALASGAPPHGGIAAAFSAITAPPHRSRQPVETAARTWLRLLTSAHRRRRLGGSA